MDKFRPSPVFRKGFQASPSSFKRQQKEDETADWDKVVIGDEGRRTTTPSKSPPPSVSGKGGKSKRHFSFAEKIMKKLNHSAASGGKRIKFDEKRVLPGINFAASCKREKRVCMWACQAIPVKKIIIFPSQYGHNLDFLAFFLWMRKIYISSLFVWRLCPAPCVSLSGPLPRWIYPVRRMTGHC